MAFDKGDGSRGGCDKADAGGGHGKVHGADIGHGRAGIFGGALRCAQFGRRDGAKHDSGCKGTACLVNGQSEDIKWSGNGGGHIMKVVIAMDSFKGSLSSIEAGSAVKAGIERVCDA